MSARYPKPCPTCGRPMPYINDGRALYERMRAGNLDCYLGASGGYYLTHAGIEVSRAAVDNALALGLIQPKWDDHPHLEFWSAVVAPRPTTPGQP